MTRLTACLLLGAATAAPAGAEPLDAAPTRSAPAQSAAALADAAASSDQIVVTADRVAQPLSRVGQTITVFDADTIATRQAVSPLDLLRQTPGVTIAQNGGPGTVASVFIRGASSEQTVALIDGVKINDPSTPGAGFDFSSLLIGNIDRIEVLRGPASVLWGSQAIGGVVNLITRQPTDRLAVNARAEGGRHGTGQGFANISDKIGPLSASVGGGYYRTDGISAFDGGRERDGFRNYAANASFNLALSDAVSVDLRGFYSRNRTEIDGYPAPAFIFADDGEYATSREFVGYAGLNAALLDGRFRNRLSFAYTDNRNRDYNPDDPVGLTFAGNGRNERAEYQGVLDISDGSHATFGAEHEYSHYSSTSFSSFGDLGDRGHQTIDSGYGELVLTPIAGLTATGGVRYDRHSAFGGHVSYSGSGVYTPNGGATTIRASYTTGFKAPSLYQLGSEYGNSGLNPEKSRGWDAGVMQRALDGRLEASLTYFRRVSRDLIDFAYCADLTGLCADGRFGYYDNVARARSQGAEFTVAVRPVDALRISANYTYLDARDRSRDGVTFDDRLARRPANSVTVNGDYSWPFGLSTGFTITCVSGSYSSPGEVNRLAGYALADLRASYPLGRHVELYGRIQNIGNERYETAFQYGQPGRAAYGGVRLTY
jgi:vitamin B12 transporter